MTSENKIRLNPKTRKPEYKLEQTEEQTLDSNWTDIPGYSFSTGYPTENAEQLLERVILSSYLYFLVRISNVFPVEAP